MSLLVIAAAALVLAPLGVQAAVLAVLAVEADSAPWTMSAEEETSTPAGRAAPRRLVLRRGKPFRQVLGAFDPGLHVRGELVVALRAMARKCSLAVLLQRFLN